MLKESQIVTGICRFLSMYENLGKLYYIRNNSGAISSDYKGKIRMIRYGKSGSSDIIIFMPNRTIFVEVKTEKGKQTDNQIEFQNAITKLGYEYYIVRDLMEVDAIIKRKTNTNEHS